MKWSKLCILFMIYYSSSFAQNGVYDSITLSYFKTNDVSNYGASWKDSLRLNTYKKYIAVEKMIWKNGLKKDKSSALIYSLSQAIKQNGTEDVAKCFIPRHAVNYYKKGKIIRYLLICFECDGVRFSDDPKIPFIKQVNKRTAQMLSLKKLFEVKKYKIKY